MLVFLWHIFSVNATIVKAAVTPPSNSMFTIWWWKHTHTYTHQWPVYVRPSQEPANSGQCALLLRKDFFFFLYRRLYDRNFWVLSYLVAADVVVTSVDAAAVRSRPQSLRHRLDVRVGVCTDDRHGPARVTLAHKQNDDFLLKTQRLCIKLWTFIPVWPCPGIFCMQNMDSLSPRDSPGSDQRHLSA